MTGIHLPRGNRGVLTYSVLLQERLHLLCKIRRCHRPQLQLLSTNEHLAG